MKQHDTADLTSLQRQVQAFAMEEAVPALSDNEGFPLDLWSTMGKRGYLGLGISEEYGGSGGTWLTIQAVGESLVRGSLSIGLALSWLIHVLLSRFVIMGSGTRDQIDRWLPRLARGETTISLAITEPQAGSHPRRLQTSATREGKNWILKGEKNYITNGPMAELFLVLAVSSRSGDKKGFTAFLTPRDTAGLQLTEPIFSKNLKPSIRCGIELEACVLPPYSVLGPPDRAHETISKPFRELEDTLLMGPVVGAMAAQLDVLAVLIRNQGTQHSDALKASLGELQSQLDVLRILAGEAAVMLDTDDRGRQFHSSLLYFRRSVRQFQSTVSGLIEHVHIGTDEAFRTLAQDISVTVGIAQNVASIRQKRMGEDLLSAKDIYHEKHH